MTYSPYTNEGQCKDAGAVAADIVRIKGAGFNTVRVYAPDCDGLKTVGDACAANGLKMIIGIFISGTGIGGAQEQVNQITSWGRWDMVELIVVGNEAIFQGHADGASLAGFVASCKGAFQGAGYTGPVTTTEPLNIWQANAGVLCGVVDVVGANIHPFFNSGVDSAHAGEFTKGQMDILHELCGKDVYNLETGWPNGGSPNGAAIPGPSEQATALKGIADLVGSKSVFFSYENDGWKNPGPLNVEQHWGCIDNFV
jgi:exo-beta-1,3-glucanase (GH17 family)